ncbi:Fanconi anemia group B protein-like isoform X1 [Mytilus edulis]|uniref:Fanconi anemia group B protein-like isoform X1 n=1 Tax=Mytilus edulis TaxID=6550 RepID=UPI0039F0CFD8
MDVHHTGNGKILHIIQKEKHKSNSKFTLHEKAYECGTYSFTNKGEVEFSCSNSCGISFTSCLEILTDTVIPLLLIEKSSGKAFDYYFLGYSFTNSKFIPLRKLQLRQQIYDFQTVDGPTVIWNAEGLNIGIQSKQSPSCLLEHEIEPELGETHLLSVKYCIEHYLIIGTSTKKSNSSTHLFCLIFSPSQADSSLPKTTNIEISQVLPSLYTNICKVLIQDCVISCLEDKFEIECTAYAVTDDGYILKFTNGRLLFAVPTHIQCTFDLRLDLIECVPLQRCYLSLFTNETITIICIGDEKITHTWSNVKQVLCDDFVKNGGQQLLILEKEFDGEKGFILTDFDIVHEDTCTTAELVENGKKTEEEKSSTSTALFALQSRLRNEVVSLNELQSEIDERRTHITELWKSTELLNQGKTSASTNTSMLISLIGTENGSEIFTQPKKEDSSAILKVPAVWKRVVQNTLVIGAEVVNSSNSDFAYVAMTMVQPECNNSQVLTFTSECYDLGKTSRDYSYHNVSKRRRVSAASLSNFNGTECFQVKSGQSVTILCKTSIPSFRIMSDVKYEMFINVTDSISHEEHRNKKVVYAGEVTLSSLDILQGKHTVSAKKIFHQDNPGTEPFTAEIQRNILALNSVQVCTPLGVRSTRFPLSQLQSRLRKRAGLVLLEKYECMVFDNIQPLEGVRLYIDEYGDEKELKLTVYTSCEDQLYLLLHHLYSLLPDDVLIIPANQLQHDITQLLNSLQEEINETCSEISKVYQLSQQTEDVEMTEEHDSKGKLLFENVRQNFAQRKLLAQSKSKLALSGDQFRTLCEKIEQNQRKTDINLIKLATK